MTHALEQALAAGALWALPVALAAGVLSGLNPCCLALYPAVTATCCAAAVAERGTVVASRATAFVFGTAAATSVLGVLAALAGHAVTLLGRGPRYAIAFVPIVMGLHLVGWMRLPLPSRGSVFRGESLAAAFVAGLLLSLVVGSCGTPVLAGILGYAAYRGNLVFGALLLFAYGVGSGLPLLLVGTSAGALTRRFGVGHVHNWIERVSGATLVGLGFYLLASV